MADHHEDMAAMLRSIFVWCEGVLLYQVIFLVLYCRFLGGKGTSGMFDPVL